MYMCTLLFLLLLHFNQIVTFVYIFLNSGCTSDATDSILQVINPSSNVPAPFSAHAPATTPQTGHRRVFNYFAARSVPNFKPTTRQSPNGHSKRGKKKVQTFLTEFLMTSCVKRKWSGVLCDGLTLKKGLDFLNNCRVLRLYVVLSTQTYMNGTMSFQ